MNLNLLTTSASAIGGSRGYKGPPLEMNKLTFDIPEVAEEKKKGFT